MCLCMRVVCIYVCLSMCVYVCICMCLSACVRVCMSEYVCLCMCMCRCACVYVCVRARASVRVWECVTKFVLCWGALFCTKQYPQSLFNDNNGPNPHLYSIILSSPCPSLLNISFSYLPPSQPRQTNIVYNFIIIKLTACKDSE